jgi:hypothetical protein
MTFRRTRNSTCIRIGHKNTENTKDNQKEEGRIDIPFSFFVSLVFLWLFLFHIPFCGLCVLSRPFLLHRQLHRKLVLG